MITENLSTLKIHKLTQAQYDRELAAGRIDETALYLTPDEEIDLSDYATKESVEAQLKNKQNKITGTAGQVVGFDSEGNAVAQDNPSEIVYVEYNVTSYADVLAAYEAGKYLVLIDGELRVPYMTNYLSQALQQIYFMCTQGNIARQYCVHTDFDGNTIWEESTYMLLQEPEQANDGDVLTYSADDWGWVPKEIPAGAKVYTATIGTSWTENEDTGVKTQTVSIPEITASNTAKVDHASTSVNGTSDGYATFVEEENQYLTYITNGYAETIDGGIKFYIFGDANTVSIPIVVEVV